MSRFIILFYSVIIFLASGFANKDLYRSERDKYVVRLNNNLSAHFNYNSASLFVVTYFRYSEKGNLDQEVKNEFGDEYRIADWNDVVLYCQNYSISQFINNISWRIGEIYSLMVTYNNSNFYSYTNRHYYISRFDHNKPGHYFVHSNIDNNYIDLGSWYDIKFRILCIRKPKMPPIVDNASNQIIPGAY